MTFKSIICNNGPGYLNELVSGFFASSFGSWCQIDKITVAKNIIKVHIFKFCFWTIFSIILAPCDLLAWQANDLSSNTTSSSSLLFAALAHKKKA